MYATELEQEKHLQYIQEGCLKKLVVGGSIT